MKEKEAKPNNDIVLPILCKKHDHLQKTSYLQPPNYQATPATHCAAELHRNQSLCPTARTLFQPQWLTLQVITSTYKFCLLYCHAAYLERCSLAV